MIIGAALGRLFDSIDLEVNNYNVNVKYDYGNQDMLDKFIAAMDKKGVKKFPLIFYVVDRVNDFNGWKHCNTKLVLMTNTEPYWLAKKRTIETFDNVLEPLYLEVKSLLTKNSYFQLLDENPKKYNYLDVPNFGIVKNDIGDKTSDKSVVTDYVDARIIDLKFKIKTDCIN